MRVFQDDRIEVSKQGQDLLLLYKKPHTLKIDLGDRQAVDDEVIRMLRMRTAFGKRFLLQKEVGKIIGVSRQMINRRWQVYKDEGLLELLAGEKKKSKITPQLLDRLAEIVVQNPFLFVHEIKAQLRAEGTCKEISTATLLTAIKHMDGRKLIMLMREKSDKRVPEAFMEAGYLIERLFGIIEDLLSKVQTDMSDRAQKQGEYENLKRLFRRHMGHRAGPTEKDKYQPRKKLKRDCKRKIGFLKRLLGKFSPAERCPDCQGTRVRYLFRRTRGYIKKNGQKFWSFCRIYRCLNPLCRTKCFTVPPKGVELYARVHRDVKKMVLRWAFHLRGSLSRVCDELAEHGIHVSLTTVLRWIKKAGEECVQTHHIYPEDWQQPLCIDEKWIKVRSKWNYVFTAVGTRVTDLLGIELHYEKSREAIKAFLLRLKSLGFRPKSITTDLLLGYENVIKEVFPDSAHYQCVLHAERDAKRIVRESFPKKTEQEWKKILYKAICQ